MVPLVAATALSLATLGAATAASTAPAPAASDTATVAPATVNGRPKVDLARDAKKVVCVNEPVTGSRFIRRICMTREQRAERARQLQQFQHQVDYVAGMKLPGMDNPIGSN